MITNRSDDNRWITTYELINCLGSQLQTIYRNADRRVGTDDDLFIVLDLTAAVATACRHFAAQVDEYEARSWRFRLVRFGAFLRWQGRCDQEVQALDKLHDLCHRTANTMSKTHAHVLRLNIAGRHDRVTAERDLVLESLWLHIGNCLEWGDPSMTAPHQLRTGSSCGRRS